MSNLDKKLDEILDDVLIGMFCRDPEGDFVPLDDAKNVLRSQAKQAIKQLVADEMREIIGHDAGYEDIYGNDPRNNYGFTEAQVKEAARWLQRKLRTKLAEWLKESV